MSRFRVSTSQLMAWAVPFLLILLLVKTGPSIERVVAHHLFSTPTTSTTSTTTSTSLLASQPSSSDPPVTTTTVVHRRRPVDGTPTTTTTTVASSSNSSGSSSSDGDLSGTFTPPAEAIQPVGAGTQWRLSTDWPAEDELSCGGVVEESNPPTITVPSDATDCEVVISAADGTTIQWSLVPVD